jgi:hypothetical protein
MVNNGTVLKYFPSSRKFLFTPMGKMAGDLSDGYSGIDIEKK